MLTSGFEAVIPKEQKIRIDARMQKPRPAGSKYLRMPGMVLKKWYIRER